MVNKMANAFKSHGIKKGDVVCIYMPVSPLAVAAMLACARIGAPHRSISSILTLLFSRSENQFSSLMPYISQSASPENLVLSVSRPYPLVDNFLHSRYLSA